MSKSKPVDASGCSESYSLYVITTMCLYVKFYLKSQGRTSEAHLYMSLGLCSSPPHVVGSLTAVWKEDTEYMTESQSRKRMS